MHFHLQNNLEVSSESSSCKVKCSCLCELVPPPPSQVALCGSARRSLPYLGFREHNNSFLQGFLNN